MDLQTFLNWLVYYILQCAPFQLDESLKPLDSSDNDDCRNINFDFIIVGAGTEGPVLASRLSENPNWNIALFEAGGDENAVTDVPALADTFARTKFDWNFTTAGQENVCLGTDGVCEIVQGHLMGGTSAIDGLLYTRGNRKDYDDWAYLLGNAGWSYEEVLPYFLKSENIEVPELINSDYHGSGGPVPISWAPYRNIVINELLEAAEEYGFHYIDYNGLYQLGTAYAQLRMSGGVRWSSSKAYLNPIRDRKNLYIFKNTQVTKVLIEEGWEKRAVGVCYVNKNGEEYELYANKEVILTAGAINTPKLLMLSGIGPKEHLEQLGINVVANLPVGKYLQDLIGYKFYYWVDRPDFNYNLEDFAAGIGEYVTTGTGILSAPRRQQIAYMSTAAASSSLTAIPDILYVAGYTVPPLDPAKGSFYIYGRLLDPTSTGTVKLASCDYRDPPIIDPNYLSSGTDDFERLCEAMNRTDQYIKYTSWAEYNPQFQSPPQCDYPGTITEEFARCFMKCNAIVGTNVASTARMGPRGDKKAVVDSQLKVHGINGLRVADTSVIPGPIRGDRFAAVVMINEKLADILKYEYAQENI